MKISPSRVLRVYFQQSTNNHEPGNSFSYNPNPLRISRNLTTGINSQPPAKTDAENSFNEQSLPSLPVNTNSSPARKSTHQRLFRVFPHAANSFSPLLILGLENGKLAERNWGLFNRAETINSPRNRTRQGVQLKSCVSLIRLQFWSLTSNRVDEIAKPFRRQRSQKGELV